MLLVGVVPAVVLAVTDPGRGDTSRGAVTRNQMRSLLHVHRHDRTFVGWRKSGPTVKDRLSRPRTLEKW